MGGGPQFWMELPIPELAKYMFELTDQLQEEAEASDRAARR